MLRAAVSPRIDWLADPAVLAPIALLAFLYVWRFRIARREEAEKGRSGAGGGGAAGEPWSGATELGGRGAGPLQALAFAGAVTALLAALASPIDGLGEDYLFSAHMLQHVLLGDVAPLLLLLSLSRVILRPLTRRLRGVELALGPFAHPLTGLGIWLVVMYAWHVPALYDAALENPGVHLLEHALFFVAGVAVWWPLIQPVPMRRRLTGLWPLAYIGAAKFGLAALGLYLTWSSSAIYGYYEHVPRIWGLSAVTDQNVGGAIMMVEQSLTFVLVLAATFVRMLSRSEAEERRRERLEEASSGVRP
ncbi:MAG: cytochrome c oxidase assembly protein [Thermoleophilaceae bacterium]